MLPPSLLPSLLSLLGYGVLGLELFLPQSALLDRAREMERLGRQERVLLKDCALLQQRLDSPAFRDRAPQEVVQQACDKLAEFSEQLAGVRRAMEALGPAEDNAESILEEEEVVSTDDCGTSK